MTFQKGDNVKLIGGVNPSGVYFQDPTQELIVLAPKDTMTLVEGTTETICQVIKNEYLIPVSVGDIGQFHKRN